MPSIDFAEVKRLVPIVRVLETIGYQVLYQSGPYLRGPCPIHGSTNPNSNVFAVNVDLSLFRCWKCGAKGNQLDLYCQVKHLDVYQSATDLCQFVGVEIPLLRK
jgi:DNA primase